MVTAEGRDAGELRSSRDGQGLALLRLDAIEKGRRLTADQATLTPTEPEWMRVEQDSPSPAPREREGPAPEGAGG
jgi:hypothetical protein